MTIMSDEPVSSDKPGNLPSKTALRLGYAGLIPFAGSALAILVFREDPFLQETAGLALLAYGAVILSFLGGVHWGRALYMPHGELQTRDFILSVLPAIFGWSCLLLPLVSAGVLLLILGYLWQVYVDLKAMQQNSLPRWFGRLRLQLTAGATLFLLVGGAALL